MNTQKKLSVKIKNIYKIFFRKVFFQDSIFSIFLNPAYISRKGLFKAIIKYKKYIFGDVLDFGCGSKPYKDFFDYKSYIGLDAYVSGHSTKEEVIDVFYDGKKIPFEDNSFDSVLSSEVFEHIEDIDLSLNELFRVMRPGAFLVFTMPFAMAEHEIPYDFRRLTSFGIDKVLSKHNFSILKTEKTTNYLEAVSQLFLFYLATFLPKNKFFRLVMTLIIITPLNIFLKLLSNVLPEKKTLFSNIICIAQKPNYR